MTRSWALRSGAGLAWGAFWFAGQRALVWWMPNAYQGPVVGLSLFVLLTGLAAERATSLRSRSFLAWFVAGSALSLLVGAILYAA